jgi:hypothetical protein
MGCDQAVQPQCRKEGIRPALLVRSFTSFDPLFEGCQHPFRPDRQFDPAPTAHELSGAFNPFGYCLRLQVCRFGHRVSTSLHPFAPPALPGFSATMGALTPTRGLFGSVMNTAWSRAGLSVSCVWPSHHSASTHPAGSTIALTRYPSASRISGSLRSRLRQFPAGSPPGKAESSSLVLRTGRSPPVASHPLFRVRSYHWLQVGERMPEEDLHLSDQTHLRTHWDSRPRLSSGRTAEGGCPT